MPSTFTPNLDLEKPETGEKVDTWGPMVNENMDKIDAGVVTVATDVVLPPGAYGYAGTAGAIDLDPGNGVNQEREVTGTTIINGGGTLTTDIGGFFTLTLYNSTVSSKTLVPTGGDIEPGFPTSIAADTSLMLFFGSTGTQICLLHSATAAGDKRKPAPP